MSKSRRSVRNTNAGAMWEWEPFSPEPQDFTESSRWAPPATPSGHRISHLAVVPSLRDYSQSREGVESFIHDLVRFYVRKELQTQQWRGVIGGLMSVFSDQLHRAEPTLWTAVEDLKDDFKKELDRIEGLRASESEISVDYSYLNVGGKQNAPHSIDSSQTPTIRETCGGFFDLDYNAWIEPD